MDVKRRVVAVLLLDSPVVAHVLGVACVEEGLSAHRITSQAGEDVDATVARIAELRPTLVVVRKVLDHTDGLRVVRHLRAARDLRHCRVLLVSSGAEASDEARRAGAHGSLSLPCRPEEARVALRAALDAPVRVIIADDSRAQRMAIVPALRAEGWDVLEAGDGQEALALLAANGTVDLLISDVNMPHIDGFTLCGMVKGDPMTSGVPVILSTTLDSTESIARGFEAGANDYLTKPVVLGELVTRARRLVAPRKQARAEQVLVVDANAARGLHVEQVLVGQGLEAVRASGFADALSVLQTRPPRLVVADRDLGEQDGVELARAMRRLNALQEVPFVLITEQMGRGHDVRAASAGIQAVVARPYAPERLIAEVERALAEARVRRQHQVLRRYLSGEALAAMTRFVEGDVDVVARAAQQHRTILFADLAGFTTLCESQRPEDTVRVLNSFFDATVPVLVRHGASIDKFIGDCIMAVYDGGPRGARGAVSGALEVIHEVLPVLRQELGLDMHLRVGINSGQVTVGDIGNSDFRRDYTVIGDAVNVAQRLQSAAAIDEVLVGEATHALLGNAVAFGAPRPLKLKGRAAEESAWPVVLPPTNKA